MLGGMIMAILLDSIRGCSATSTTGRRHMERAYLYAWVGAVLVCVKESLYVSVYV